MSPRRPSPRRARLGLAKALLLAVLTAVLAPLLAPATLAAERIHSFNVEIEVAPDGDLLVSEHIAVEAEGKEIERGIFRDLTIVTPTGLGLIRPEFEILQVLRDGEPEPYHTERTGEGFRIYIGEEDVFLRPGRYDYLLRYRIAGQVGFHEDYDEVYWNVTGDDWAFPIARATATVIPPRGYDMLGQAAYTGRRGETGRDVAFRRDDLGYPHWETTAPLAPGEGLTVAVSWQKGLLAEPDTPQRLLDALLLSHSTLSAAAALAIVLAYYLVAWHFVGRDPHRGPIVPTYEAELPPAAMRFILRKGFDRTAFVAALINMAVKGHLRIVDQGDRTYLLEKASPSKTAEPLSKGEAKVYERLFSAGSGLKFLRSNRKILNRAQTALSNHLRATFDKAFFSTNRSWFIGGAAITLIAWIAVALTSQKQGETIFIAVWLSFWTLGTAQLLLRSGLTWTEVLRGAWGDLPGALILSALSVPFVVGWVVGAGFLFSTVGLVPAAFLIVVALTNILFFELLEAHTPLGREIADEIEGLKLYLSVAEKDRLEFHNPPERTPEHFERMLPYALALGVENRWAEQFASVFEAMERDHGTFRPHWYSGHSFSILRFGDFTDSFTSELAKASSAPSKSGAGGSFGGGFSGGGGGGGGGGGW